MSIFQTRRRWPALLAAGALLALPFASAAPAAAPAALREAAIVTPKALGAAMLAVASAGPRLVAVGERGTILYSDDGGNAWRQAQVPVQASLSAVQFIDARIGWAVGHLGVVLHTRDGGKTWVKQLDGIAAAALALGAAPAGDAKARAGAEQLVADGPDKPFLDLYFENANSGYVVGAYNQVFKTSDGGRSWQPWQARLDNPKGLHLYSVRAAGGSIYVAGEQGLLLRSDDQGASFSALASPYKGSWFGMVAARGGELVLFGLRGNAFWSGDKGQSWRQVATGVQASLAGGVQLADGSIVLVSQAGDVLSSADQGRSFKPLAGAGPLPLAAVAQAPDAALVVAGLRGVKRLGPQAQAQSPSQPR